MTGTVAPSKRLYVSRPLVFVLLSLYLLFSSFAPALFASMLNVAPPAPLLLVFLATTFGVGVLMALTNAKAALLVALLILPWQPLLSMPLARYVGSTGVQLLVASKDVYVLGLLATLFLRNGRRVRWRLVDLTAVFFVVVYALYTLISPAALFGRLVSFREGFMVAAFYFVGRLFLLERQQLLWYARALVALGLVVALFGYMERFLFDEQLWTALGAGDYVLLKQGVLRGRHDVPGEIPFNWHTRIGGTLIRRMVSSIGDPTSLSRFLSLPVLVLLFLGKSTERRHRPPFHWLILLGLVVAVLLTFGRGGLLIILTGTFLWTIYRWPRLSIFVAPGLLLLFFAAPVFSFGDPAVKAHLSSARNGIDHLIRSPIGLGVGTAGQKALYFSGEALAETGESYLAALAYQTGVLGVAAYFIFFGSMALAFWIGFRRLRHDRFLAASALLAFSLTVGIFITSLFANSAVAPISAGPSLIFCGATMGILLGRSRGTVPRANALDNVTDEVKITSE